MGRWQRALSLVLRLVILGSIILALADTRLVEASDRLAVYFVLDGSHSVGEGSRSKMLDYVRQASEKCDNERKQGGVVAFGRDALVEANLGSDLKDFDILASDLRPDFSNLVGAINLALASLPDDASGRIVVLSDGNENIGDAMTAARIAANRGVEIDTVPFGEPTQGEVSAGRLILPRRVQENEMFDVRAVIESQGETDAVVEVYENEKRIGEQKVHLVPGKNVFTFPRRQTEGGFYSYRVQVLADGDMEAENNQAIDYTVVEGSPKICYVSGDPGERPFLVHALQKEGIRADFVDLSGLPTSLVGMAPYDAIMFSDVGAELLMPDTMRNYQSYVRNLGGGFAMIGGENSFGPGGYFRTPIEEMLPVDFDLSNKGYMPSIAICLMIDCSGSMGGVGPDSSQKVEIVKNACRLVVELLDKGDELAVIAYDFSTRPMVPLTKVQDKADIINTIGAITAGGGSDIWPGMNSGFEELKKSNANVRHMIVLSDYISMPFDFKGLADDMNSHGITLTTIAVGTDANVPLGQDLANWGGGSFYQCDSLQAVPQIFTKETFQMSKRALVEEPFTAVAKQVSPATEAIDFKSSPPLLGYVATNIKSPATEALSTHRDDPLLAHWQYGLGRSLAFTSDAKAHWAAGWINWPGFEQMWTQAVRWLVGSEMQGNLVPNIHFRAGQAYISIDAFDSGGDIATDALIKASVVCPGSQTMEINLFQVAPGRYEESIDATEVGTYLANIYREDPEGNVIDQVSSGFSVSFPPEYEQSGPNLFLLSQLADTTGGKMSMPPSDVFRSTTVPINRYFDLWYYLLLVAICALPLDIAVRRLSITGESTAYVRERVGAFIRAALSARSAAREKPSHIDQLKKVKEQYRLTARPDTPQSPSSETDERIREILSGTRPRSPATRGGLSAQKRETPAEDQATESSLGRLLKTKKKVREDGLDGR